MSEQTVSETLFEMYLKEHGFEKYEHEPDLPGSPKHPDYKVHVGSELAYFEIKEFEQEEPVMGFGVFDPYPKIREKINKAAPQLQPMKGQMCSIVLCNPHRAFVFLDDMHILGAMLGDVGWTMPFNPEKGSFDSTQTRQAFLKRGKMIRYDKSGEALAAQNTTISAICVLQALHEGNRRFHMRVEAERAKARDLSFEEIYNLQQSLKGTEADSSIQHLRMVIYENPHAVRQLTSAFGSGPWDERIGVVEDQYLARTFVGTKLQQLENDEHAAGIKHEDPMGFRTRQV